MCRHSIGTIHTPAASGTTLPTLDTSSLDPGGNNRLSQAWISVCNIPSPNNPASTVSVTTRETLEGEIENEYNVRPQNVRGASETPEGF